MSLINRLRFVKKQHETDDIYTFYFSRPAGLRHKSGKHGLFVIPGFYRPHPFSISSAADEEYVTISTHVNTGSRYKQKLMKMTKGQSIIFMGPIMNFTFVGDASNYVFLAQGIGITPFRSMLVHANMTNMPVETTLIHVDSKGHAFKDITEKCATRAYYPTNPDDFRKFVSQQDKQQLFYLSGSPRFVSSTKQFLTEQGVARTNIKTDSFLGY